MAARRFLVVAEPALDQLLGGGGYDALDAVPGHVVEAPRAAAHDGLPDLDRLSQGARHECDLSQRVTAVGHIGGNGVALAVVREGVLAECLQDDLHLLFEELAVRLGVQHRVTEALHLAGVVAASYSEDDPALGQDIGGGIVFGEPERVPGGHDVEGAADLDALGAMGEVHGQHQNVGDALVTFVLEVVLGQPQGLIAQRVGNAGQRRRGVERLDQAVIGIPPVVGRRAREAALLQVDMSDVERGESCDHRRRLSA
jgi:hypothetical protein